MSGRMSFSDARSHLDIHTSNTMEMKDAVADYEVGAAVKVAIVLKGRVQAEFDGVPVDLDARDHPVGFIWSVSQPSTVRRYIHKGSEISKVMISARLDWVVEKLKKSPSRYRAIADFFQSGISVRSWQPSRRILALTNQLIYPHTDDPLLLDLYSESRGLEIFAEALGALQAETITENTQKEPDPIDQYFKAQEIREFITDHILDDLNLTTLSLSLGMSVANLQRIFKNAYGTTIKDFIRETRLVTARDAMEKDGLTIGQAAWLAGYSSPANFATAFKRVFGMSPSDSRDR
ncbi:helix-turn-helix transcriptional regulator [Thalassospira sp.]|uniref:helix-turn-helix transcriptional regulator n=1 Tax=Thalassospira sp. TaxID=1912094 RepID=UPI0032EE4328